MRQPASHHEPRHPGLKRRSPSDLRRDARRAAQRAIDTAGPERQRAWAEGATNEAARLGADLERAFETKRANPPRLADDHWVPTTNWEKFEPQTTRRTTKSNGARTRDAATRKESTLECPEPRAPSSTG